MKCKACMDYKIKFGEDLICDDCIERSGEVDTFANWEARGLPGTGWSVCRGACYCVLVPEDVESSNTLKIDQNQLA